MQNKGQRIEWIDAAKGACILAVILYHFNIFIYQGIHEGHTIAAVWNIGITALKPLRMPLFFLISGYLASTSITRRSWGRVRTKKIASLLWVYVLWAVIYWAAVSHLLPDNPWFENSFNADMTLTLLLERMLTANISLWYLYALVIYFVVAKVMRSAVAAIGLGVLINIAMYFFIDPANWGMRSLIGYFVFFALGAYAKDIITTHYAAFNLRRFACTAALTLAGLALASYFSALTAPGVEMLLGFVMVSTVIDLFALACRHVNMTYLCMVGRQTLPIYVMHRLVLRFISPYMPETVNTFLLVMEPIIATIAVAAVCLFIYHGLLRIRGGRALFTMPHTMRRIAYRTHLLRPVA
ncbi:membrane protein [Kushneria pakistanensis]|uniref:Membrane protein n=1 Tax=Kushneria pakistanensis TaxID=1508770 RepID=A0ABQ3FFY8_9GAMM|nr:acyltransferase family protein [Kushneria pakistanensis]GHC22911.1 membrane protein [Kushneria pakistanensis]